MDIFIYAVILGASTTVIPCPIMMILIRTTIRMGFLGTVAVSVSTLLADSIYGFIGAFSMNNQFFAQYYRIIDIICGISFLSIAYNEATHQVCNRCKRLKCSQGPILSLCIKIFILSMSSPLQLIFWMSEFGVITDVMLEMRSICTMVFGSLIGAMFVWLTIGLLVLKFRRCISKRVVRAGRYISAVVIASFGIMSIIGL